MTKHSPLSMEHRPRRRKWSAQLGAALIVTGILAFVTIAAGVPGQEMLFGWLVVVSGVAESIHAFYLRKTEGFFLHLFPGITAVPIALLLTTTFPRRPESQPVVWILMFASYFLVLGLFRMISAVRIRFAGWRWAELDGSVTFLLGVILWVFLTRIEPAPWALGAALGTSLMLRGCSLIMFAMHSRETGNNVDVPSYAA